MLRRLFWILAVSLLGLPTLHAQVEVVEDVIPDQGLRLHRYMTGFGQIHSNGFGFGMRIGRIHTMRKMTFFEAEFIQLKHPKAKRTSGMGYEYARRYIYGGINELFSIRGGYGVQYTLNQRPYFGGLQVDLTMSGGVALGLAIPQYISVLYFRDSSYNPNDRAYLKVERFSPDNPAHNDFSRINGAGPIFKGLFHLRPYPSIYGRIAFNFDFGKAQDFVRSIEAGAMIDIYPIPIAMMASHPKNYFFANFYLAFHLGKRYNK